MKPHKDSSQAGKPAIIASVKAIMAAAWLSLHRNRSGCSGGLPITVEGWTAGKNLRQKIESFSALLFGELAT